MITRFKHAVIAPAFSVSLLLLLPAGLLQAQTAFRTDRILVKPTGTNINSVHTRLRTRVLKSFPQIGNIQVVELPQELTVADAIAEFERSGTVQYAEPDYISQETVTNPNDPKFTDGTLWGLHNTGQNGGVNDADIDAPEGWDRRTTANNVIVAVIDSGIRYTHQDLAANMWTNPGEIAGNGLDDDCNGYIDDIHGINAVTTTGTALCGNPIAAGDPNDDYHHGTHVAGIIGAVGNNGLGVVGVAWSVKLMALKALDSAGLAADSDLIECINYATKMRAHIINASWGKQQLTASLREAIAAARDQGILFVAAAGNFNLDNDNLPVYPAGFDIDNIISVAATSRTDARASYSDWGLVSVHLAAPGGEPGSVLTNFSTWTDGIYSTWNSSDSGYQYLAGTSMAAPQVCGALALMKAYFQVESYVQLKNRLLASTDALTGFSGVSQTGGRLNLNGALSTTSWRPRNDNFANPLTIARPSSDSSITFVASNVDATKETGEPNHAGNAGGKSVWWNWTAPNNNSVTFTTSDGFYKRSGFDTLLAIYTGSSVSTLTLVASDNNGGTCGTSQVTFTPVSGTTYRIAVDGYNGAQGTIKLTLQTSPPGGDSQSLRFALNSLQRPSGQFKATLTGPPSVTVALDISPDLQTWTQDTTFTFGPGGSYDYTDNAASSTIRFYRARFCCGAPYTAACNLVGYVDRTMPAGQSMHCNPFNANDNRVSALFAGVEGTTILKWNDASQTMISNGYEFGQWSDPNMTFVPGEGFIFQNNSGGPLSRTFLGEVVLGHNVNQIPNLQSIRSSIVPQAGRVVTDLLLPVVNGDTVTLMINGSYTPPYTFSNGAWSPSEPTVSIGESFWNNKTVGFAWHRNFQVWP